ncbi:Predicted arabinose efflux permease, MFS family [Actinacidiphila alni]|uniref:Predicted arabinose efflux permease, MFS family n=1 Tax=Actinacidiphila alni TaxID=380248 RepID=A0A1I2BZE9_9ACTN|nr:Predicted arabinose efflux permease, MFS family [Actinacidiphila alni]
MLPFLVLNSEDERDRGAAPSGALAPEKPEKPEGTEKSGKSAAAAAARDRSATPLAKPRRRLLADISPLREHPDFRRLWFGNTISYIGQQMTAMAVSLQVYAITGSSFYVGLVGLCSLVPLIVFGLYGGAVADAVDRRRLGLVTATGATVCSAVLAAAAIGHLKYVGLLYAVVALQAVCFAMNSPARSSMIPRLLPPERLPAANALASLAGGVGQMAGPMLGAVLVGAWGYQAAYLVDVAAFTASLYAMWRLPAMLPGEGDGAVRRRPSVMEGLRYLASRPNLRTTFVSDLAAMVLAQPRVLFPAVAGLWYGGDTRTVGLLAAAPAVGALLGSVFSGWLGRVHRQGFAVLLAVGSWGAAVAVFGLTRNLWLGLLFLAFAGCADTVSMVFRNTMLQSAAPDDMRGRLQGVFLVVVVGGPRLGDFLAGSASDLFSPRAAVIGGGLACIAAITLIGLFQRSFPRYDSRHPIA